METERRRPNHLVGFCLCLFVSAGRICPGIFALHICMPVAGLRRVLSPAALFPGHTSGVAFLGIPGWEFDFLVPSRCFWLRGGHAREELLCSSSRPCVLGTRFLRYALTDLVPPGAGDENLLVGEPVERDSAARAENARDKDAAPQAARAESPWDKEAARRSSPIPCRPPRPFRRHHLTALRADAQRRP